MSLIEKLDGVLAQLGETSEGNYLSRLANGTFIALEAIALLSDHGPAIRQAMIDAERLEWLLHTHPTPIAIALETLDGPDIPAWPEKIIEAIDKARATGEGGGNG